MSFVLFFLLIRPGLRTGNSPVTDVALGGRGNLLTSASVFSFLIELVRVFLIPLMYQDVLPRFLVTKRKCSVFLFIRSVLVLARIILVFCIRIVEYLS